MLPAAIDPVRTLLVGDAAEGRRNDPALARPPAFAYPDRILVRPVGGVSFVRVPDIDWIGAASCRTRRAALRRALGWSS